MEHNSIVREIPKGLSDSPFFASVSHSVPKSEVTSGDDSIFDGRRLPAEDKMTGRGRSVPVA